jgi:glycosyltransferase involved in cell wall biosynthesis
MRRAIAATLRDGPFDLIQIEGSEFADLPFPAGVPIVVDEHNIWSELTERRRRVRAVAARRRLDTYEATQLRRLEERVWGDAAGVAFCSEREVDAAHARVPDGRFAVVPNGVDTSAFRPDLLSTAPIPGRLAFVGLLRYTPNADAANWLVSDILPLIRERAPDMTLDIVGKEPSPHTLALADAAPGIRVLGSVPDVRPLLAAASVVVVPLRVGSGTRIKILQAMAMGRPVVSTTMGAEGLDARDGEHLLLADDPVAFAAAVTRLLDDEGLRTRLGVAGRAFVLGGHTWDTAVGHLLDLHDQVLAGRTGPAT